MGFRISHEIDWNRSAPPLCNGVLWGREEQITRDEESVEIWKRLFKEKEIDAGVAAIGSEADGYERGMKEGERIFYYDAKKNWWSRAGVPENMPAGEPGGPDSEMFYDFGTPHDQNSAKNATRTAIAEDFWKSAIAFLCSM